MCLVCHAHGAPFGNAASDTYRDAGGVSAKVTETITLDGLVGGCFGGTNDVLFAKAGVTWAPSSDTKAGANIEVHDNGGYRGELTASKSF